MTGFLSMFQSSVRIMLPLLFAAMGVMLSARVGFINMSMEGGMLGSAFVAVAIDMVTGSAWIGQLGAILFGIVYFMCLGFFVIRYKGNHVVCSLGFNFIASGATIVLMSAVFGGTGYSPYVSKLPQLNLPLFGLQSINFFAAIAIIAVILWLMKKTVFGLQINAIGENTAAADSLGIPIDRYKFFIMIMTGVLAGMGGSELALGQMGFFAKNMTSSTGFLAYSAVVFAGFKPSLTILTTFVLAFFDAFQMRAQTFTSIPSEFLLTLPYVITIIALVLSNSKKKPAMLGKIYIRDQG
ncbi:MAG: ABC transporter permease [Sphaerochaetaceae bacterium]